MGLEEIRWEGVDWIRMAQDKKEGSSCERGNDPSDSTKWGDFSTRWGTISVSCWTLLCSTELVIIQPRYFPVYSTCNQINVQISVYSPHILIYSATRKWPSERNIRTNTVTPTGASVHGLPNLHSLYTLRATDPLQEKQFQRRNNDCIIQETGSVMHTRRMRIISHLKVCSPATFPTLPNPRLKHGYRNKPPKASTNHPASCCRKHHTRKPHAYQKSALVQSLFNNSVSTGEVICNRMWWGNYYIRLTEYKGRRNWYFMTLDQLSLLGIKLWKGVSVWWRNATRCGTKVPGLRQHNLVAYTRNCCLISSYWPR
jgi:hypothetical protein